MSNTGEKTDVSNADIMRLLMEVQKTTTDANSNLANYIKLNDNQLNKINARLDGNDKKIEELQQRLASIEAAGSSSGMQSENMEEKLQALENKLSVKLRYGKDPELHAQNQLSNNVVIHGIPAKDDEQLGTIVMAVGKEVGVKIKEEEISEVFRKPGRGMETGVIVVKFSSFRPKVDLMKGKKERKKLLAKDLGLGFIEESIVYVNQHTTPFFGNLLRLGRKATVERKIDAAWLTQFGMAVRKSVNGEMQVVKSVEALEALIDGKEKMEDDLKGQPQSQPAKKGRPTARGSVHKRKQSNQPEGEVKKSSKKS